MSTVVKLLLNSSIYLPLLSRNYRLTALLISDATFMLRTIYKLNLGVGYLEAYLLNVLYASKLLCAVGVFSWK